MKEKFDRSKPHVNIGTIGINLPDEKHSKLSITRIALAAFNIAGLNPDIIVIDDMTISEDAMKKLMISARDIARSSGVKTEDIIYAMATLAKLFPSAKDAAEELHSNMLGSFEELEKIREECIDIGHSFEESFIQKKMNKYKPRWQR